MLKAGPQTKSCAVKDDIDIGNRKACFSTDFCRTQLDDFTHHKDAALLGRQAIETGIEYVEKLSAV